MKYALARIAGWAVARPGPVLAATVLLGLLAAVAALGLKPETGTGSLVDRDSEAFAATEEFKQEFGDDAVVVLVEGDLRQLVLTDDLGKLLALEGCLAGNLPADEAGDGETPAPCVTLARRDPAQVVYGPATFLNQAALRMEELLSGQAEAALAQSRRVYRRAVRDAREQGLSTAEQQQAGEAAAQELFIGFEQQLAELALEYGLSGPPSIDDPQFVSSVVFDSSEAGQPKARFAYLFPSAEAALISVRLRPGLSDAERGEAIGLIREAVADPAFSLRDSEYVVSGVPVVADGLAEAISREAFVLLAVAFAVMAITLGLVFGPPLRLLPLAIALTAVALTFGVLAAVRGSLTMASVAVLPVLIGLGVDYGIQFQARFAEALHGGARPARAALEAAGKGGPVIATAALATGAGFLALLLSPIPQVRGFGLLLVLGIAFAFVLALTAGLATLSLTGERAAAAHAGGRSPAGAVERLRAATPGAILGPLERAGSAIGAARHRVGGRVRALGRRALAASIAAPGTVLVIAAVLATGGWVAGTRTEVISDLRELVPRELSALRDVDRLQEATGVSGEVTVTVDAADISDPEVVTWMRGFQRRVLDGAGFERGSASCLEQDTRLCPSVSLPDVLGTQQGELNQRRIRRVLNLLPPYFSQAVVNRDPDGESEDTAVIAFGIKVMPFDEQKELIDSIRAEIGSPGTEGGPPEGVSANVVGLPVLAADANAALQGSQYLLALVALIAVALVLLVVYRSARRALVPLIPIVFVTGWTALVLWAVGVPLNPMSATLGALVIAITTEFSVILAARYEEERERGKTLGEALRTAYARTGTVVAASGITGIAGFATLIATDIRMLRDFGLVTVIDLAVVLVGVLLVLPAALAWTEGRKLSIGSLRTAFGNGSSWRKRGEGDERGDQDSVASP
jgi:uncharacterized protein